MIRYLWMIGLAAGLGACTLFDSGSVTRTDLDLNRRLWAAQNLANYRMTYTVQCFCPAAARGPFTVTVVDGQMRSVEPVPGGDELALYAVYTVEGLFQLVEDAYARGAARVEVTYHPDLGYPTRVFIDDDARAVDEELGIEVTALFIPEAG